MSGFIPISSGINTTLGRGGSDYTAAIMAALDATDLEI
jgi:aspartokinase/homoserine dehydrogenase 1